VPNEQPASPPGPPPSLKPPSKPVESNVPACKLSPFKYVLWNKFSGYQGVSPRQ
jgi:hypothetical protein